MNVSVKYDRVGGVFSAGETVTGVVLLSNPSSTSHSGITLEVEGTVAIYSSVRGLGAFEAFYTVVKPVVLLSATIPLALKGDKLPAGVIEMPFAFELKPDNPRVPLLETYQGVYISCLYHCHAHVQQFLSKISSEDAPFQLISPGQSMPRDGKSDPGIKFSLSNDNLRTAKRFHGDRIPLFEVEGHVFQQWNDIDVPLSGWVKVVHCESKIASLELQLIRVEACATSDGIAREATEIQNIQIGDGDVMRGLEIPIYMFFPRWYTCPSLKTANLRVDFEINVVVTLQEQNQVTQNVPIKLFRST